MPDGDFQFYELGELVSWVQYSLAARSLLRALDLDDPEKTVLVQLTLSELSMASFGLILLVRLFPEFLPVGGLVSSKMQEVCTAQGFVHPPRNESE